MIDPNFQGEETELPKGFVPKQVTKNKRGQIKSDSNETESLALTAKNLEENCPEKYVHDNVDVKTEDEKKEEAYRKQVAVHEAE